MQLKALQIQGFKSFPDKIRLDFSQGITAVVGPNGSGKSNISDAVRWVLGEQSTKTLRSGKMEDIIFVGTRERKPNGFACVELTIDNTDRRLAMDCDEITISRKIYRSGDSEYRLNNTTVRLKDINELLMDTGLGRDGYCIIGQGRIAEIVDAKTTQRREIFEEAAGISRFRYRKAEAEKQLQASYDNLVRLKDILGELESRVGPLKEQAEKAELFLVLAGEKKTLEISLWIDRINEYKERLESHEQQLLLRRKEFDDQQALLEDVEKNIAEVYKVIQELAVELSEIRDKISENDAAAAQKESQVAVMENDLNHNARSISSLKEDMQLAQENNLDVEREIKAKEQLITQKVQEIQQLRQDEEKLIKEQTELLQAVSAASREYRDLTDRQNAVEKNLAEQKLRRATSDSLIKEMQNRLDNANGDTKRRQDEIQRFETEIKRCKELLQTIEETAGSWENSLQGYEMKLQSRLNVLEKLTEKKNTLLHEAEGFKQRARVLRDMEHNMEGFQSSVKYVMNKAEKGELKGIHGPVSKLIATQEQYATAVEIALGAAMQNIVVKDEYCGKTAINMLKNSGQGRATFLPLTAVKGKRLEERGLCDEEGYVGIASELVEFGEEYRGIVENLLGRTVLAQDMDCAISIAKRYSNRFRLVTLDGQVINAGGSMTGGSIAKKASILSRQSDIAKFEQKAQQTEKQAADVDDELRGVREQTEKIQAEIKAIHAQLKTASEDKIKAQAELERCSYSCDEAKRSHGNVEREYEELKSRIEKLAGESGSSQAVIDSIEDELSQLREKARVLDEKRTELTAAQEAAALQLSESKLKVLGSIRDKESLEQEKNHLVQIRDDRERQSRQTLEKINSLFTASDEIRKNIELAHKEKERITAENEELRSKVKQVSNRREELELKTTNLRGKEREIAVEKERASAEVNRLEDKKLNLQKDYDGIISNLWDEYNLTRSQASELAQPVQDRNQHQRKLMDVKGKIRALGTVNVAAIEEFKEVGKRYTFMKAQVEDVENSRNELIRLIRDLTGQMRELFLTNFNRINEEFGKIFVELFGGGSASLSLIDEENVLESGIDISVQPPGKIIKNLNILSGGEKAFIAIAIYFAILRVNPAPFVLLDEIEAALDDVNVSKYASYLRKLCDITQFITITHRRGTMEEADILYGVTMQEEGVTKLLKLDVAEMESKLGITN